METNLLLLKSSLLKTSGVLKAAFLLLVLLLIGTATRAQIVYSMGEPGNTTAATSGDLIKKMNYDGTNVTTVITGTNAGLIQPLNVALDGNNNRIFVSEGNLSGNVIKVITGSSVTGTITSANSLYIKDINYDVVGNWLYYITEGGDITQVTANDALYRVHPDGTGSQIVAASVTKNPYRLEVDAANNKVYVVDVSFSGRSIKTVDLANSNAVTSRAFATTLTSVYDVALDKVTGYLYYCAEGGSAATLSATDQVRRQNIDGTNDVQIAASVCNSPFRLGLDAGNNRLYVGDAYYGTGKIVAINLTDNTFSTTLSFATGQNFPQIYDFGVPDRPTVTTAAASSVAATSATLGGTLVYGYGLSTERGVVYSSSTGTPTLSDTKVSMVTNTSNAAYSASVTGLSASTTYYARAYAVNGAGTTYGSVITFSTPSNDATLSGLALSSGTLSPTFAAATTSYTASVTNATTSITVTPTRSQANATIKVNNTTVVSGSASGSLALSIGDNTITTVVTAQDGSTTKTYTLTVNRPKVVQTITFASAASKTYGDADFAAGGTINTSLTIAYASSNTAVATVSGSTIHIVGAGTATITASQAGDANNAAATSVAQMLTVSQASQTITFGTIATKTYGDADFAAGGSVNSNLTVSYASSNTAVATVSGSTIHIVGAGSANITASQAGDANRSAATSVVQALTVNKNAIAVTAAANQTKVYGNADPASYTYTITTGTLKSGDSFTGALARAAGSDAGTYAINVGTLSLNSNYTLTYTGANFTITKRPLEITPTVQTKAYGDAEPASYTYQFTSGTSLASGDAMTGPFTRPVGEIPGVYPFSLGTKHPVNISTGADATSNYTLSFVSTNLTITKRLITLRPVPATKVYGNADPGFPYQFVVGSVAPGEGMTGTFGRAAGEDAGVYALTLGTKRPVNATTGAATDQYYIISFIADNLTITKRTVNVTANAQTKTYGDADPDLTYSADALGFSDTFSGALTRATGQSIGTYAISQGTLALNTTNYTLNFTGANLTIGKKIVNVTATAQTKTYGDADPALTYTADALASGDSFTGAITRATGENFGTYAISQGTLALNSNYTLNYTGANLTINKKTINVTAAAKSKTYGDSDPALTYTADALVGSESFTGAITRASGETAGNYAITQGTLALSSNYTLNYTSANFAIAKRSIDIYSGSRDVQYGDPDGTIGYSYSGTPQGGDVFSGALSREPGTALGTYATTIGTFQISNGGNYDLIFHSGAFNIIQREIIVSGGSTFKIYGDADPAINYSIYSGSLLPGAQITGNLARTAGETAGPYNVNQGTLAINDANYKLTFQGGYFEIDRAPLTFTIDNLTKVATKPNPALTYSVSGYKNGDTEATAFTAPVNLTTDANINSAAGTYNIYPIGGVYAINYDITITGGTLTVTPASTINTLASATLNGGGFNEPFDPANDFYSVDVPNGSTSAILVATVTDPLSSITIGYDPATATPVASGAPYTITFTGGNTEQVPVNVTAEDGTVHSYYFNVTPIPSDSKLSNLDSDFGIIAPSFNPLVTSYTLDVSAETDSVTITPTTHDRLATARVSGGGEGGANGAKKIGVYEGGNPVNIVVRSADRTSTSFYSLYIKRPIRLKTLTLSAGNLIPAFDPNITTYVAKVPESIPAISVTPQGNQSYFQMEVNGDYVNYGDASAPVTINADGSTTISVKITAGDGETSKTYTINVQRPASVSTLAGITLSEGTLSPAFDTGIHSYNVAALSGHLQLTPVLTDANASSSVTVNGSTITANAGSYEINLQSGATTVVVTGIAEDGSTTTGYTITFNWAPSTDNYLAGLTLSGGRFLFAFDKENGGIPVLVPNALDEITVTPVASDAKATITVNGQPTLSGMASQPLAVGGNYNIVVTAEDGTPRFYQAQIQHLSTNASLYSLTAAAGGISPTFNRDVLNYSLTVPASLSSTGFIAQIADTTARVSVNGSPKVKYGYSGENLPLAYGDNVFQIAVSPQEGEDKVYTLTITRSPSSETALAGLTLSQGTLSPGFSSAATAYTAAVPYSATAVTVTPSPADANGSITAKVNGANAVITAGAITAPLNVGDNTIAIASVAQDGTTVQTYTITVSRADNAFLNSLALSAGTLSPVFDKGTYDYTASVSSATSSITLTPTAAVAQATVKVNGVAAISGTASAPVALTFGANAIPVEVTADGVTRAYKVTVSKAGSTNAYLSKVALVPFASLTPVTGTADYNYTASVPVSASTVKLNLAAQDAGAKIRLNGTLVAGGTDSAPVALTGASTVINIAVTAEDGITVKTYKVTVNKTGSSNAYLSKVALVPFASLTPVTGTADYNYTASVPASASTVKLNLAAQDAGATIRLNGTAVAGGTDTAPVALTGASTVINIAVTAEDGITVKTYKVTVNKAGSNNAYLSKVALVPYAGLTSVTGTADYNYTASVPASASTVKLNLAAQDAGATIRLNGTAVAGGTDTAPVALAGASTVINIAVTAEDGITVKTYKVTVNKAGSSNAYLSKVALVPYAALTSVTGTADYNYTASVPASASTVKLNLAAQDAGATIRLNGSAVAGGTDSAPVALAGPSTIINIAVTAEDGITVKTYKVTVNKAGSNNAYLSKVALVPFASLKAVTGTADYNYTASVPVSASTVKLNLAAQDAGATIRLNGTAVAGGTDTAPVALTGASTVINIAVTAEDGITVKTYKVTVNKTGSSNAYLSKVALVPYAALTSVTGTADYNYTASVPASASTVKLNLAAQDTGATIRINGTAVAGGTDSEPVTLTGASTVVNIAVTAEDGVTVKTYKVTVSKAAPPVIAAVTTKQGGISKVQETEQAPELQPEEITVKQAVSPNGDGINDRFTIEGIQSFPENTVRIMNRNGDVIYEAKGYDNEGKAFDGHSSKGTLQQPGTYFYSIEYKKGTESKRKTGYIVVKY